MATKKETKKENNPGYTVKKDFRDSEDFSKVYSKGEDVSHFNEHRLKKLVDLGHVENKNDK